MRITNLMMLRDAVERMDAGRMRIDAFRRQVASGKKYQQPSDDPATAVAGLQLRSTLETHQAYLTSARTSHDRLIANEQALKEMVDLGTRALNLALQARSDTQGPAERRAIAAEINQMISDAVSIGNREHAGSYIFAGFQVTTQPYTFNGVVVINNVTDTAGPVTHLIEPGHPLTVNVDGNAVLNPFFAALIALRDALNANDMPALESALASLRVATDGVLEARTTNGARQRNVAVTIDRMGRTETDLKSLLSLKEDVNLAEAIANLQQQENVYQAVLQSTRSVIQPSLFDFMR
jgi:flagellar hook-associated protein 3 FlgL